MTFTPRPSQQADLEQIRAAGYRALLNIQTGYGKTVVSCMAAVDAGAEVVLIIAPQSTHRGAWKKDVKLVTGKEVRVLGNANKAQKQAIRDIEFGVPGFYVITPQLFTRIDSTLWYPDMLIVDEVHQLGNPGSKGQRKLSGYDNNDEPISLRSTYVLALSATPARNNFERMWSVMRLLWPHLYLRDQVAYDNHWQWKQDRMESKVIKTSATYPPFLPNGAPHPRAGEHKEATLWLTESEPGRLIREAPCVIQHFKRQACCEFHPEGFSNTDEPVLIERDIFLNADQKRILKELEEQALAWLEDHPLVVELPIVMHQRLRQVALGVPYIEYQTFVEDGEEVVKPIVDYRLDCKSPVVDEVLTIAEQLDDAPFVVFLESQRFAKVLVHQLNEAGIPTQEYSGKKKADLERFGKDYRVLVGQLASVGTGTDGLQHVAKDEVWVQASLDDSVTEQGEGRLDRDGQTDTVQRFHILDDHGMFKGQLSKQLQKRLELNQSLRKAA